MFWLQERGDHNRIYIHERLAVHLIVLSTVLSEPGPRTVSFFWSISACRGEIVSNYRVRPLNYFSGESINLYNHSMTSSICLETTKGLKRLCRTHSVRICHEGTFCKKPPYLTLYWACRYLGTLIWLATPWYQLRTICTLQRQELLSSYLRAAELWLMIDSKLTRLQHRHV